MGDFQSPFLCEINCILVIDNKVLVFVQGMDFVR